MTPTLYDLLGVPQDATGEEISRAWRDAVARFEPGAGGSPAQFRLFNEAAETLLDPERRAEYDAQLAATTSAESGPEPATEPGPEPATEPVTETGTEAGAPAWLTAVLAALAVLATVVALAGPFVDGLGVQAFGQRDRLAAVDDARDAAPAAAERAAATILAYDYRTLDEDQKAAERLMTADYREQYAATFELVREHAPGLRAAVEATVKSAGVTHAEERRVDVLLFVDQVTRSRANEEPQVALNRVGMRMVEQDGSWLVDAITSY